MPRSVKNETLVVSALSARANFGKLLSRVEDERLADPEVLRLIGEESQRKGTDKLTSRQIDQVIKAARSQKPKR